jgi:hypothetical protein
MISYQPRTGVLTKYLKPYVWVGPDVWIQTSQGPDHIPHGEHFGNDRKEVLDLKPDDTNAFVRNQTSLHQ